MKLNTLRWLGVSTAAAAAAVCWCLLSRERDSALRTRGNGSTGAAYVTGVGAASKPAEPWPEFDTPEFRSTLAERAQLWLDSRGRDAGGLIAIWDMTGDAEIFMEANENFPNDPRVCMAVIQNLGYVEAAMPWIERLIAAEPNNPNGLYQKVCALMVSGDRAGAITVLRQAAEMSAPTNDHLIERSLFIRDAAIAAGASPGDAARLAVAGPREKRIISPTLAHAGSAFLEEVAEVKAAGNDIRLREIIGIGLRTVERFSDVQSARVSDRWLALDFRKEMLADLPDDMTIPPGGSFVGHLRAVIEEQRTGLVQLVPQDEQAETLLNAASDDVIVSYANCLLGYGELVARSRLLEQAGKSK